MLTYRNACTRAARAALGLITVLGSRAEADLLQPGSRSGSISVAGSGTNSGIGSPSPISQTLSIPTSGDGNVTGSVWSYGFGDGFGSPPANTTAGVASSSINLNQVAGSSYSLSANSSFGFVHPGSSGQSYISTSYSFDQQIVIAQPVDFTLLLSVTRPANSSVGATNVNLPVPSETFSGPGITTLSASAPYSFPPNDVHPMTVTQSFTGSLAPGTYALDSTWALPTIDYGPANSVDSQITSVSATLSVSSVPEPASCTLLISAAATLVLRRKKSDLMSDRIFPSLI